MPFDEKLLEPVSSGFDEKLLEPDKSGFDESLLVPDDSLHKSSSMQPVLPGDMPESVPQQEPYPVASYRRQFPLIQDVISPEQMQEAQKTDIAPLVRIPSALASAAEFGPLAIPAIRERLPEAISNPMKEYSEASSELASGFTSPSSIVQSYAMAPLFINPLTRLATMSFLSSEQLVQAGKELPEHPGRAVANVGAAALMFSPLVHEALPRTVSEITKTKGVPDAIQRETESPVRTVQTQPGESQGQVPGQEVPVGIRSGIAPEETARQPEVPLTPVPPQTALETPKESEVYSQVVPGVSQLFKEDIVPAFQGLSKIVKEVRAAIAPANEGEIARGTAENIREKTGELAQKNHQVFEQFKKAKSAFDKTDQSFNLAFINRVEEGLPQQTPELQSISDAWKQASDKRVMDVQSLGTGKLEHVIEDYFPHLWTIESVDRLRGRLASGERINNPWAAVFGKRPLAGKGSFLKQRRIPTVAEGMAIGLEPVSHNPVELMQIRLGEMDKYVMGQKVFEEMKDRGVARFVKVTSRPPSGYELINDKIARVTGGIDKEGALRIRGYYYAPKEAAAVLNNYLSPGLKGNALYDGFRWVGNSMNQAQLGLSLYHLLFTGIDVGTSKLSLGLERVSQSRNPIQALSGLKDITEAAVVPVNYANTFLKGWKVAKEYTKPGSVGGQYSQIAQDVATAGGRVRMDPFWYNQAVDSFWKAFRSGNYPGAVLRAPFAVMELLAKPVMEVAVPKLKLGVFADLSRNVRDKLGPAASPDVVRSEIQKVWDSVDNRMGQMVYDNLFWNKILKDLSFLAVRSVGWNLGTIRELGGGVLDSATILKRLRAGDSVLTHRMAYTVALPVYVGFMGSILYYLYHGKAPDKLEDYYLVPTGRQLPNGEDERVILPSYLKDIFPLARAVKDKGLLGGLDRSTQMALNKAQPLIEMLSEMKQNKDFFGEEIRNKNDPFTKQVSQEIEFMLKQFKPFTVTAAQRREGGFKQKVESFFGIMPASAELTRTKAMNMIAEYRAVMAPIGGRTREQTVRKQTRADVISRIRKGDDKAFDDLADAYDLGVFTKRQYFQIINDSGYTAKELVFKTLPLEQAENVFQEATPEEKNLWEPILESKRKRSGQ